ncbi:MAG: FISUMP domain-containing protein, partial [Bacteroidota bacterium]
TATPNNGGGSPVYQWKVNGINAGTNSTTYTYNPVAGDQVLCILNSSIACPIGNPATSNTITMNVGAIPLVTFTTCFDTITTLNAKPIKLKGGIPLNGTYSGPGVSANTFNPAAAGVGTRTITYTYTNAAICSASKTTTIIVQAATAFTCGNSVADIRDGKSYPTVQIGSQCWMAANLNYGTLISSSLHQRDNCINEKYCYNDLATNCGNQTYYQWDEIMRYDDTPAQQGLCPPGWHVPTEAEWNTLFSFYINNGFAGSPLKYSGYSGFNALLSGVNHFNRQWDFNDFATFFWSSTPYGPYKAWSHGMNDYNPSVSFYPSNRANAFAVRCIKDI